GSVLAAPTEKITIAAFHPWTITEAWDSVVQAFQEEHPDIEIELIQVPEGEFHAKVRTLIASGMAPDLAWNGSVGAEELAEAGILEDLTPYLKKSSVSLPRTGYIEGALTGPRLEDGRIYA